MLSAGLESRVVVPDIPHHITPRGNRRPPTFFDDDYAAYRTLLGEWPAKRGLAGRAACDLTPQRMKNYELDPKRLDPLTKAAYDKVRLMHGARRDLMYG